MKPRGRPVWLDAALGALLFLAVALSAASIYAGSSQQQETNRTICVAINRFDKIVSDTLKRSRENLPHVAYFRSHPAELAYQERQIREQLKLFAQTRC